jgi:hypothetical protein
MIAAMRRHLAPIVLLALLAGCGGGGGDDGDSAATGDSAIRGGPGDVIITPGPAEAQAGLAKALKPLLKAKSTACAVTVLSDVTALAWVNISKTLMDANLSLTSAMALQTADLRKSLGLGGKDLGAQRIPVQIVVLDGAVSELRIEGADLRAGLEAAGIAMDAGVAETVGSLSQTIEYTVSASSVTIKAPKTVVGSGKCSAA